MDSRRTKNKKNIIITSCNAKYGEFLINHWLRSLKVNVDLREIDVAVIDYGLTEKQVKALKEEGVLLVPGSKDGHIANLRFADALKFLKNSKYEQVLSVDGGDVIFQEDISKIFKLSPTTFRVVTQESEHLYFETNIPKNFKGKIRKELWQTLIGKSVINAGVIFALREKFMKLCEEIDRLAPDKNKYGADQIITNFVIYRDKYTLLPNKYNFMPATVKDGCIIKDGIFYKNNGEKAVIVHNVGGVGAFRAVKNFGYGKGHNINRERMEKVRKGFFRVISGISKILRSRSA